MSRVVLRLALTAGGAGGLRRDFEFTGSHFPIEREFNPVDLTTKLAQQAQEDGVFLVSLEHTRTALAALNMLCEGVMRRVGSIRKSLIIKMERAKGFEPSNVTYMHVPTGRVEYG